MICISDAEPEVKRPKIVTAEMADEVCNGFDWRELIRLQTTAEVEAKHLEDVTDSCARVSSETSIPQDQSSLDINDVRAIAADHGVSLTENQARLFLPEINKLRKQHHQNPTSRYNADFWLKLTRVS